MIYGWAAIATKGTFISGQILLKGHIILYLKRYFTCIYMSVVHLLSTRSYWGSSLEMPAISQTTTCNIFEQIKRFLHFNDNNEQVQHGQPGYDKLFKIRPFLNKVREITSYFKEECLAVDEQIIPTKAKKPHKWGYKIFVLSDVSGFSYLAEVEAHQPDLGASSNVVVNLTETVHRNHNYKVFFDNWFTGIGTSFSVSHKRRDLAIWNSSSK
jgi:hypothetical protein